ncbi:hypothetical protein A2230_04315 [candidate division WOR-1 bacterium RIFOXYA2_FULL_36_21]|uniref:Uncharacterized protein n=1 Tax=candidate division WOR-1 bacterium RIFOXYB2_FULL_36_35 TaxID=1802578 RepID=A0A1F4S8D4_UNCSA|nr:MAG: hypothetical protein A2230_04315 [candidate division WOR-1 bacterium RIFOXYA2_FULL_36_21]OGC16708.1 MAG: hypothetical protein A2290_09355 [candidate division WOR-1 bacterium RIFOXYB2_FULL_36_35]
MILKISVFFWKGDNEGRRHTNLPFKYRPSLYCLAIFMPMEKDEFHSDEERILNKKIKSD